MKYCTNCGEPIEEATKFCPNCGEKISVKKMPVAQETQSKSNTTPTNLESINQKIALKNNQSGIVKKAWFSAGFFVLIVFLAFSEIMEINPAVAMISIFLFFVSLIIGFMFRSREKKLQTLITGENLLAQWTLTTEQKKQYVNFLFKQEAGRNQIILFSIAFVAIIVWGIFIAVIDEGKVAMLLILVGLLAFLSAFAYGMPYYYRYKNSKGDGQVLIGAKYAYINGYFHNWDFPLSGLSKIKKISEPFYGLHIAYYYTDRTLKHSEALTIPVDASIALDKLILELKASNKLR